VAAGGWALFLENICPPHVHSYCLLLYARNDKPLLLSTSLVHPLHSYTVILKIGAPPLFEQVVAKGAFLLKVMPTYLCHSTWG